MQPSTKVIVFASQKGGSGKTTLSGHIAVQAVRAGFGPVGAIDTDPQGSLEKWHEARADTDLILRATDPGKTTQVIDELRQLGAATIVVDTPPAATAAIGEAVRNADLVCIPARPSPHDLRAVGATIDIVEAYDKPMIFVLNSATERARITGEAALALSQHGTVAPVIIHNRVAFAASMTDGRTVMEADGESRSANEVLKLWDYIVQRLGKIQQWRDEDAAAATAAAPTAVVQAIALSSPAQSPERAEHALVAAGAASPAVSPIGPSPRSENMVAAPASQTRTSEASAPAAADRQAARPVFGQRKIIASPAYIGPDRRQHDLGPPSGTERRKATFGQRGRSEP